MEYNLLNLLQSYGLIKESQESFDFSGLTDEQLDVLADKAEMEENYYKSFMLKKEIEWRKLSPEEQAVIVKLSDGFSLNFNGYANGVDASNGYYVTDHPVTKSTFVVKSLDIDTVADAYVNKLKQFYPDTWQEVIENDLAAAMQDEYKDAMLSRLSTEELV